MIGTPFLFGDTERAALAELRERAAQRPVEMRGLAEKLKNPAAKKAHMRQMTEQSVELSFGWLVTFSIEIGHPIGTARHMSMSSPVSSRVPRPEALWMVAEALGFVGSIGDCTWFPEKLQGHAGVAINLVQPLNVTAPAGAGLLAGVLEVEWRDGGREPQERPDPNFPEGKDIDASLPGQPSCSTALPYPAKRCGVFIVTCARCGLRVGITVAGRPDDPRSFRVTCQTRPQ